MPKPHIKPYNMRTIAEKDEIEISTQEGELMLKIGKDGMRRIYCDQIETAALVKIILSYGYQLWGEHFLCDITEFAGKR